MGKKPTFTVMDFSKRILDYLQTYGAATTEEIMKEVSGTNFRLVDGIFLLLKQGKIRAELDKYKITWVLKDEVQE